MMYLRTSLSYLASPYNNYTTGSEQAFIDISAVAGHLIKAGLMIYCPIAHCHPIATHSGMDLHDYEVWLPLDKMILSKCDNLIVAHLPGWEKSRGIKEEVEFFEKLGRPIFDLDVRTLCFTKRVDAKTPADFNQISFGL